MSTGEFEKTNWSWQLYQFQQQAGEWIELQLSKLGSSLPKWSFPQSSINTPWIVDLIKALVWLLLALCLIWLLWQLWQLIAPYLYSYISQARSARRVSSVQASELSADSWLQRSQAYFKQGNYREACRCLYLAMLQRLDETGIATHQQSRTDREYLKLVQQRPQSHAYQTLITTHEQLCFGNAEILPETFEQCRQAYREISGQ